MEVKRIHLSLSQLAENSLNDLRVYLSVMEPALYQTPLELLSGSTIGQHTRHIIEFYTCLIEQSSSSVINYSKRRRDFTIESQPDHALYRVNETCEKLASLDLSLKCQLDCSEHGEEGLFVDTTLSRELIYNIEHTVHHLAIIKIALKAMLPALNLPENFGVAPSTLRHRHEACAQ